ncbi:hypothetical protein [Roseimicrobium sp. ORNL1]|uniref:hypothetical protein n=1 Tax=Roseimicrobium sp. ORNL1 TaxID=2711231 RepID=UPI0013E1E276|nr:hypothetical protein [Roseimicrobium sp. ORNL1]QIF04911.1 hypothetical protein G5S37_26485 [Roseimicrobium sp. ORNL1]
MNKNAFVPAFLFFMTAVGSMVPAPAQSPEAPAQPAPLPFKEEKVGNFQLGPAKVEGAFVGTPITVDEAFTTEHENGPPSAAFKVIVPKEEDVRFLPGGKKTGAPELLKLTLPNADATKAVEIIRFVTLTVPMGTKEVRQQIVANLLKEKVFPMVTNSYEQAKPLDLYATKVGSYDAVSMHLEMTKPTSGEVYLVKAIAILHPTQPGSVLALVMADNKLSEVKTSEDLQSKGFSMKIIHSLKFLDEAGAKQ